MTITLDILFAVFPKCDKELLTQLIPFLNKYLPVFGIDTKLEVCHFLAQAGHETDSFQTLREYASGKAYEGRSGLGNVYAGDGKKFKGRGIFQTTGRTNYAIAGKKILENEVFGLERNVFRSDAILTVPNLLELPQWAVASACIYWVDRNLSSLCKPDGEIVIIKRFIGDRWINYECSPIEAITRKVNGGMNGFAERKAFYEKLSKLF